MQPILPASKHLKPDYPKVLADATTHALCYVGGFYNTKHQTSIVKESVEQTMAYLLSLPIEQRMEAMGMENIGWWGKGRFNRPWELGPKAGHALVYVERSDG